MDLERCHGRCRKPDGKINHIMYAAILVGIEESETSNGLFFCDYKAQGGSCLLLDAVRLHGEKTVRRKNIFHEREKRKTAESELTADLFSACSSTQCPYGIVQTGT